MMQERKSKKYYQGFKEGQEALRERPKYAPTNPYDDEKQPELYEGWDDGVFSAGICDLYTNGVYTG